MIPVRPLAEFPPTIIRGRPPTAEELEADAAYQHAIDAWTEDVKNLYFRHFGIAER